VLDEARQPVPALNLVRFAGCSRYDRGKPAKKKFIITQRIGAEV
jgi:hypothetical protein